MVLHFHKKDIIDKVIKKSNTKEKYITTTQEYEESVKQLKIKK